MRGLLIKCEWNEITFRPQYRKFRKRNIKHKKIIGWDTETDKNGFIFLLANSSECYLYGKEISIDCILPFMTKKCYRRSLNVFYNIDFDISAILKLLPAYNRNEIKDLLNTTYKDYFMEYIPGKVFKIQNILKKKQEKAQFFDIAQFFHMKLNTASSIYLNDKKKDITISNIEFDKITPEFKEKIIEYCLKDCILTKQLGEYLQVSFTKLGIDFSFPISTAYLSSKYFMDNCQIPRMGLKTYQEAGFLSYAGGRFECIRKGTFDNVFLYDINSAYPYQISILVDFNYGVWVDYSRNYYSDLSTLEHGFLQVRLKSKPYPIQPIWFRQTNGLIIFPQFKKVIKWITIKEYNFIVENDLAAEIKILKGYLWFPAQLVYPFKKEIKKLYNERLKLKDKGDNLQLTYKILLNSLYGKTLALIEKFNECPKPVCKKRHRIINDTSYCRDFYSGQLFNPIYASEITAGTRLEVFDFVLKTNSLDDLIGTQTDSILTTKKLSLPHSSKLGDWSLETSGKTVILGSGVYSIENQKKIITKFRGFIGNTLNKINRKSPRKRRDDLFFMLNYFSDKKVIKFLKEKPLKFREGITRHLENKICAFEEVIKYSDINFDKKRIWNKEFINCGAVLRENIGSRPIIL